MEANWLPTVLNMFIDIPNYCPIVQNLVIDVSVDWVLKGLPSVHLTLAAYRQDFSSSAYQTVAGATQVSMTSNDRRKGPVSVLKRVYQVMPFLPLN